MDPNATYAVLLNALAEREIEEAREHFDNLAQWIERGGYLPAALAGQAGAAQWHI